MRRAWSTRAWLYQCRKNCPYSLLQEPCQLRKKPVSCRRLLCEVKRADSSQTGETVPVPTACPAGCSVLTPPASKQLAEPAHQPDARWQAAACGLSGGKLEATRQAHKILLSSAAPACQAWPHLWVADVGACVVGTAATPLRVACLLSCLYKGGQRQQLTWRGVQSVPHLWMADIGARVVRAPTTPLRMACLLSCLCKRGQRSPVVALELAHLQGISTCQQALGWCRRKQQPLLAG